MGWIVFAAVAFGLYTGWCFLTFPMTKGTIERTVNHVLDKVSHDATDEHIRVNIIRPIAASPRRIGRSMSNASSAGSSWCEA